ncbi:MAG: hypothetical protein II965_06235 [Pyramidobacter sp.]|nr:hypothetical protein [Pyramidobacter sp.]MBQ9422422.1 hypothetical protein [Pyramidobacter sp.]
MELFGTKPFENAFMRVNVPPSRLHAVPPFEIIKKRAGPRVNGNRLFDFYGKTFSGLQARATTREVPVKERSRAAPPPHILLDA